MEVKVKVSYSVGGEANGVAGDCADSYVLNLECRFGWMQSGGSALFDLVTQVNESSEPMSYGFGFQISSPDREMCIPRHFIFAEALERPWIVGPGKSSLSRRSTQGHQRTVGSAFRVPFRNYQTDRHSNDVRVRWQARTEGRAEGPGSLGLKG